MSVKSVESILEQTIVAMKNELAELEKIGNLRGSGDEIFGQIDVLKTMIGKYEEINLSERNSWLSLGKSEVGKLGELLSFGPYEKLPEITGCDVITINEPHGDFSNADAEKICRENRNQFNLFVLNDYDEKKPILDDNSMDQIVAILKELIKLLKEDKTVYIHCHHGLNRTATIVTLLLHFLGYTLNEACVLYAIQRGEIHITPPFYQAIEKIIESPEYQAEINGTISNKNELLQKLDLLG